MKIALVFMLIIVSVIFWVFNVYLTVNDKRDSKPAFVWKSIFYWIAVVFSFIVGISI